MTLQVRGPLVGMLAAVATLPLGQSCVAVPWYARRHALISLCAHRSLSALALQRLRQMHAAVVRQADGHEYARQLKILLISCLPGSTRRT